VTQEQIARELGLSRSIVTQAMQGTNSSRVSAKTQQDVREAARRLGYRPRNVTTHTVALVVRGEAVADEATGTFLRGVENALRQSGYRLTVVAVHDESLKFLREVLTPKSVDGVIFTEWHDGQICGLLPSEVPFIVASEEEAVGADVDVVTADLTETLFNVTNYLMNWGHHKLGLITPPSTRAVYRHMEQGVRRALYRAKFPQAQLELLPVGSGPYDQPGGERSRRFLDVFEALAPSQRPTAIIAADLWVALPAFHALRERGYRIPEDVSFISVLESHLWKDLMPSVTATTAYNSTVAGRAVTRLIEKIKNSQNTVRHERLVGEIIERASVGEAPSAKDKR
jgi:LacI family transcriptional regulator